MSGLLNSTARQDGFLAHSSGVASHKRSRRRGLYDVLYCKNHESCSVSANAANVAVFHVKFRFVEI